MSAGVLSYLRRLLPSAEAQLSDGELLHRFAVGSDETAFTELLRRYGPLVWGVCRRVLADAHDAEDAFQATFLQLARRAGTLRRDGALSGWLHTVATRLARRANLAEQRRRRRDRAHVAPTATSADDLTWRELRQLLDVEIARLPIPYRQPLILCYLESCPHLEAAHRLGLAPDVLRGRLERGRQTLRRRLEKLGLPLAATLLLTQTDRVPAALGETTRQMVCTVLAGGPVPLGVASLASSVSFLSRSKFAVFAAMLLLMGGVGIGSAARRAEPGAAPTARQSAAQIQPGVDALGDPLPPGAIGRLGTRRHRVQTWLLSWRGLPDGKSYLAYQRLGQDNEIRRLDAATGRILETWRVPNADHPVGFSPDGRYVLMSRGFYFFSGIQVPGVKYEQEWALTLYDLVKREAVWVQRENLEEKDWKHVGLACFAADGKWIATTGEYGQGALRLWDAATGKEIWNRKQDVQPLVPLGFLDGAKTLVLRGANDNTIFLFDRPSGKQRRSFPTMPRRASQQCGLAPDGSAVLFGWYGPSVLVWDVATGKERVPLDGHKQWARCFAFSSDGKTVVTGSNDSFVHVRAWPSGEIVRTIELGRGNIDEMAVSRDGRWLEVMFWGEQALHFYDLTTGKARPAPVEAHRGAIYGVARTPDGQLVSCGKDATIRTWDLAARKTVGLLAVEQDLNSGGFAVSGDGRLMAVPDSDNHAIYVYERATGKRLRKLPTQHNVGKNLVLSPEGRWLAADQRSGGILQVWDVTSGLTVLRCQHEKVYCVPSAFSADGRQFAASADGMVRFWDVGTWKEQAGLKAYASAGLAYSPDGRTLATASVEGVRLFELVTGQECAHIRPNDYPAGVLLFSPTGRWLAWTCGNRRLRVWDVHRGEVLGSFTGHDDAVTGLAFSADERTLVSSSDDSTLLIWDVAGLRVKQPSPKGGDVEQAWQTLGSDNAKAAAQAIRVLASSPDSAVPLLARHLKPASPIDTKRIQARLRELDSDRFADRERATRELEQFGSLAAAAIERFLAGRPSLEARRRAEQVLEKIRGSSRDPQRLREIRALEALERIGDMNARRLIEALAKGAPDAPLTRDARAVLTRMRR